MNMIIFYLDKIRNGKKKTSWCEKNEQIKLKSDLGEIKRGNKKIKSKEQKMLCTALKCFIKQGTVLLNFMIIIL